MARRLEKHDWRKKTVSKINSWTACVFTCVYVCVCVCVNYEAFVASLQQSCSWEETFLVTFSWNRWFL